MNVEQIYELRRLTNKYIFDKFNGDYNLAFKYYDKDSDGKVTYDELLQFIRNIGFGATYSQRRLALEMMTECDSDGDGLISQAEIDRQYSKPRLHYYSRLVWALRRKENENLK